MLLRTASLLALLVCTCTANEAFAQDPVLVEVSADTVEVVLQNGTSYVGVVESVTTAEVQLRTESGVLVSIPRSQIRKVGPSLRGAVGDRKEVTDPNHTRLLFAPTARPLRSGQGYVAAYELFFPFVAIGATDVASIAGGVSLIPGADGQIVYAAPKLTFINRPSFSVAGGVIAGTFVGNVNDEDIPVGGLAFAVATLGDPDASFTIGAGYAFLGDETADRPVIMLGGEYRISSGIKLLSENYIVPGIEDAIVVSGGVRFFGERLAADLALITAPAALGEGGFPFLPWIGIVYNFGSR